MWPFYSSSEQVPEETDLTSTLDPMGSDSSEMELDPLNGTSLDSEEAEESSISGTVLLERIQEIMTLLWALFLDFLRVSRSLVSRQARKVWTMLVQVADKTYRSIDLAEIRSKSYTWISWLGLELHHFGLQIHDFLLERRDIWLHHSSTLWLHQRTSIEPQIIVAVQAGVVFLMVSWIIYRLVRMRKPRRLRGTERSRSFLATSERGARDRGFSVELSGTQSQPPNQSVRKRIFTLDFFRKSNMAVPPPTKRDRSGSYDFLTIQGSGEEAENHAMGHAGVESARTATTLPVLTYYGPMESKLIYSTWTPPPCWMDASRALMPTDTRIQLQREISLDLSKDQCTISIREPSSSQPPLVLPVVECSIHVKTPLIGGVLEIYVKDSSKEEWMEHTFDTAKNAAQFQIDMLAIQLFGAPLHCMYQTLELIHQGSMACEGREYVCHHDTMSDEQPQGVGVAWDDLMRALGSNLPSLRVALERLWWHHYSMNALKLRARKHARKKKEKGKNTVSSSTSSVGSSPLSIESEEVGTTSERSGGTGADADKKVDLPAKSQNEYIHLSADYVRRRLLLGPVDFFRLFVPFVPETALPNNESNKRRMAQLLRWRKRVATAALLAQAYVKARILVNKGWVLSRPLPTHYLTRRLSFDDNIDNTQRDTSVKNEYYEATVSRDVLTFVRPNVPNSFKPKEHWWEYLRPRKIRTAISKYQAYTLLGVHVFHIPQDDAFPLNPAKDPVLTFRSLRQLIEPNPDLEFMVFAFFPQSAKVCYVCVYVRSLPKGLDTAFDRNVSRFKHGSKVIRDKKLSIMVQLGSSETKTMYESTSIHLMTSLMKSVAGDLDASTPDSSLGPSDRTPFPLIPMCRLGETHHFGGDLQTDRKLPQNYCAVCLDADTTKSGFNIFARLLMSFIERGFFSKAVHDITFVLAANEQDELPERALGTMRLVRADAKDIALPSVFVYSSTRRDFRRRSAFDASIFKSVLGHFSIVGHRVRAQEDHCESDDEDMHPHSLMSSTVSETHQKLKRVENMLESQKASVILAEDPVEKAVNELVEILGDVKVPVRRDQLPLYDFAAAVPMSLLVAYSTVDGISRDKDLLNMSLLLLTTRGDIKRHYIASGCNMKKAAIRIVETAAWRGQTFPIDQRICRIELQSGQFFQQGTDLMGHPIFYFRNMGLGPWRKDNDASVAAVLHRLEGALWEFAQHDDDVQCTLVVIMGKPYKPFFNKGGSDAASTAGGDDDDDDMAVSMASASFMDYEDCSDGQRIANPRVNPEESWQLQTSKKLIRQMIKLISAHYPERLYQCLVVMKPSQTIMLRKFYGSYTLSTFVNSPVTRSKVKFLNSFTQLQKYVSKHELVTIAGGETPINPEVFGLGD